MFFKQWHHELEVREEIREMPALEHTTIAYEYATFITAHICIRVEVLLCKLAHLFHLNRGRLVRRSWRLWREYAVRRRQYLLRVGEAREARMRLLRRSTWDDWREALSRLRADRRLAEVADAARRSTLLKVLHFVHIFFHLTVIE